MHALVRAEQSRVTSFRLGVTWHGTARQPLSEGSLDLWMALGLYYIYKLGLYILFDHFYLTWAVPISSSVARYDSGIYSFPTLGATLPRTDSEVELREPTGATGATGVNGSQREPTVVPGSHRTHSRTHSRSHSRTHSRTSAGLEPCGIMCVSYWSGRTVEFSPAHEGRD